MSDAHTALALAFSTLASEDLAAVGAAVLAARGQIDIWMGTAAVAIGIYSGDLLLFACGRVGQRVGRLRRWLTSQWSTEQLSHVSAALDQRLAIVIITSRFLPGTRLPMYVGAGLFSQRPLAFCLWTLLAVATWTPMLVFAVHLLGAAFEGVARSYFRWTPAIAALVALRVARVLAKKRTS